MVQQTVHFDFLCGAAEDLNQALITVATSPRTPTSCSQSMANEEGQASRCALPFHLQLSEGVRDVEQ